MRFVRVSTINNHAARRPQANASATTQGGGGGGGGGDAAARATSAGVVPSATVRACSFSGEAYESYARESLRGLHFYEVETARRVVRVGHIATVFSAYATSDTPPAAAASRTQSPPSPLPAAPAVSGTCGLNMAQLMFGGGRWWLVHLVWEDARRQRRHTTTTTTTATAGRDEEVDWQKETWGTYNYHPGHEHTPDDA